MAVVERGRERVGLLARVPWKDDFIRRDSIDIARTVLDRLIALRTMELCRDIAAWRKGGGDDSKLHHAPKVRHESPVSRMPIL